MKNKITFQDQMNAVVERAVNKLNNQLQFKGQFNIEHVRDGKVIGTHEYKNLVVNEGKNLNLNVTFGATAKPTWYMSLFDNTGGGGSPSGGDTMTSHAGWNEFTGYSNATRPAWGPDAAASQAITNSTPVSFAITATATIMGGIITSNNTKGGTSGTLWSAGTFSSINVVNGDTLRLTYTLSIS